MTALNSVRPRLTRRTALTGAAGVMFGLASGCQRVNDQPSTTSSGSGTGSGTGSGSPSDTPGPTVSGPASDALLAITATRLFVQAVGTEFPRIRTRTTRVARAHLVHEDFLADLVGSTPSGSAGIVPEVPSTRKAAERALATAETRLAAELSELAVVAEDGPLARALASISAGTSQVSSSAGWPTKQEVGSPPPNRVTLNAGETLALQRVLEREHATLWWYGVLGGRTSAAEQPGLFDPLTTGYVEHRRLRDQLTALLSDQGVTPAAAEPVYPIDWNLRSRQRNVEELHRIEHDSAAAYSWLVAETRADLRRWAVEILRSAAIRDLAVQGTPENFPGADELADR